VVDIFGTAFFTVYNALIHVVEGPPVLPPGSTVSVATSTLRLPCNSSACAVEADWYFPADMNPQRLIYFQHGFLANGPMYSYTAATLAERTHSIVVAPSLTSNFFAPDALWLGGGPMQEAAAGLFVGDRAALNASAAAAVGHAVVLPHDVVLVGHSLGGGFVLGTAGYMVDNGSINDLAGVVMLDGVAFDPALPEMVFGKVPSDLPIYLISSEPYTWNMYGQMSTAIVSARPGQFNGFQLAGGRHIDYMEGGNPLIQLGEYLVAGFSQPQNIEAAKILEIGWINDMFGGTHNGIYAPPSQAVAIPTNAGIAVATSLPAPAAPLSAADAQLQALTSTVFNAFFHVAPASEWALL
jgi:pimeloyl-ACP methyl ester carboxylesterase